MVYFAGLDLSLTGTGVSIIDEKGKNIYNSLIKSKKTGDRPMDELDRLISIKDRAFKEIHNKIPHGSTIFYAIEGVALQAKNTVALSQLSGLNYFFREAIFNEHNTFFIIAPTSLKKFITGAGNAKKELMLLNIYKKYGCSFNDDNIADAYALARGVYEMYDSDKHNITPSVEKKHFFDLIIKQI